MKTRLIWYVLGCLSMFFALKFFKPPQATPGRIDTLTLIKQDTIIQKTYDKLEQANEMSLKESKNVLKRALSRHLDIEEKDSVRVAFKELPAKTVNVLHHAVIKADAYDTLERVYVKSVNNTNELVLTHNDLLRDYAQLNATIKLRRRRRWRNAALFIGIGIVGGILIAK